MTLAQNPYSGLHFSNIAAHTKKSPPRATDKRNQWGKNSLRAHRFSEAASAEFSIHICLRQKLLRHDPPREWMGEKGSCQKVNFPMGPDKTRNVDFTVAVKTIMLLHMNCPCLVYFFGSLSGFSGFLRLVRLIWTRLWFVATSRGHCLHRSAQLVQLAVDHLPSSLFPHLCIEYCRFGLLRLHRHLNNSEEEWRAAWKNSYRRSGSNPDQNGWGLWSFTLLYWAIRAALHMNCLQLLESCRNLSQIVLPQRKLNFQRWYPTALSSRWDFIRNKGWEVFYPFPCFWGLWLLGVRGGTDEFTDKRRSC